MQQDLLTRVRWDDTAIRADIRAFVGDHLAGGGGTGHRRDR